MEVFVKTLNKLIEKLEKSRGKRAKEVKFAAAFEVSHNSRSKYTESLVKIDHIIASLENQIKIGKKIDYKKYLLFR